MPSGKEVKANLEHPLNAYESIIVRPSGKEVKAKLEQEKLRVKTNSKYV